MRNFFSFMLIAMLSFGLVVSDASAKRFGGGRSFGVQRSQSSLFSSHASQKTKSFGQQANTRKWGGVLGGLLMGGLLASLFMGHGLGSGILSWLILGSLVFFVVGFLRKKMQPGFQSAQASGFRQPYVEKPADRFSASNNTNGSAYPNGFVPDVFLREAKVTFIRLQAAYDQQDKQDLRSFTAPEVFAEIEMQLKERGDEANKTEVIDLKAELLDVSKQVDSIMASVRFTGSIKENDDPITSLDEIWHFRQFASHKNWVGGGIQQEVVSPV